MRKSPTFNTSLFCSICGDLFNKTGNNQKYCPICKVKVEKETKRKSYIKYNPNAYKSSTAPEKCSICDLPFSSHFKGVPYCNKHYLRMYHNGTAKLLGRKTNDYRIKGTIVEMHTNQSETFIFDLPYLDKIKQYSWCTNSAGYLVANIDGKVVRLHRYILNLSNPSDLVDHIDGNPLNNTISNLRICSNKQNVRNSKIPINNTSGYTGVRLKPSGRYQARIMVNRKEINLGMHDTFEEAKATRIKAEHKYFKEYSPSKGATSK